MGVLRAAAILVWLLCLHVRCAETTLHQKPSGPGRGPHDRGRLPRVGVSGVRPLLCFQGQSPVAEEREHAEAVGPGGESGDLSREVASDRKLPSDEAFT